MSEPNEKTTLMFRRVIAESLYFRVIVFCGVVGRMQQAGEFLVKLDEWEQLEPCLKAAGRVEIDR